MAKIFSFHMELVEKPLHWHISLLIVGVFRYKEPLLAVLELHHTSDYGFLCFMDIRASGGQP